MGLSLSLGSQPLHELGCFSCGGLAKWRQQVWVWVGQWPTQTYSFSGLHFSFHLRIVCTLPLMTSIRGSILGLTGGWVCKAAHVAYGSSQSRGKLELQVSAYTSATAMQDLNCVCDPYHISWQHRILNPLSKVRNWNGIFIDTSQAHYPWARAGTPGQTFDLVWMGVLCWAMEGVEVSHSVGERVEAGRGHLSDSGRVRRRRKEESVLEVGGYR